MNMFNVRASLPVTNRFWYIINWVFVYQASIKIWNETDSLKRYRYSETLQYFVDSPDILICYCFFLWWISPYYWTEQIDQNIDFIRYYKGLIPCYERYCIMMGLKMILNRYWIDIECVLLLWTLDGPVLGLSVILGGNVTRQLKVGDKRGGGERGQERIGIKLLMYLSQKKKLHAFD